MTEKRSRPKNLTTPVKRLIYHRALTQRDIPRDFLANTLIKEIEDICEIPPSFETAKRYISKARNSANPIDKPWSIACCSEYSTYFPPESISEIMYFKKWIHNILQDKDNEHNDLFGRPFSAITIRDAIWFVRLKPLVEKVFSDEIKNDENMRFGYIHSIVIVYTMVEITCGILDEHFVSFGLDEALVTGNLNALARIAGLSLSASSKPTNCDNECESCKYIRVPGSTTYCMPKLNKEDEK